MRVLFTGGSGKAGRHATAYLRDAGHTVLNVDLVPSDVPGIATLLADITDLGQMINAMTAYANFDELRPGTGVPRVDAVVHFAAIPRILIRPDNETFRVNTVGTYNVLEAATKLGVPKIVFASSETTYGICFADGEVKPDYLPVDEDHPTVPMDSYGLSKVVNERTAQSFQRRSGADIYGLRIGNVIAPDEYHRFAEFCAHPEQRLRNIFCYIDARDLGQIVHRCLVTDGLAYQVFNAANDTNSVDTPNADLIARFYDGVTVTRPLEPNEALFSNAKARRLLGFRPEHDWRGYV